MYILGLILAPLNLSYGTYPYIFMRISFLPTIFITNDLLVKIIFNFFSFNIKEIDYTLFNKERVKYLNINNILIMILSRIFFDVLGSHFFNCNSNKSIKHIDILSLTKGVNIYSLDTLY